MGQQRKRRQYGTGSVYRRKADGRWVGSIEAGFTRTGARRRVTVTGATEAEAKARLKAKARALDRGEDLGTRGITLKAWAEQWLAITERTVTPNTHTTDRAAAGWITEAIGARRLDTLTPADVRAVSTAITAAGKSTATAHRYHGVLIRMLKAAFAEGHRVPSRVLSIAGPTAAPTGRRAMPLSDALAILEVASTLPHGSRWVAALLQGMRQGECLGLCWDQVGADSLAVSWQLQPLPYLDKHDRGKGFRVPDGYEARQLDRSMHLVRPKSRAGWRVLPIIDAFGSGLDHWRSIAPPSPHGLVWPAADGSPADEIDDRNEWYALQDTVGVRHPSGRRYFLHEARNTTATLLMELGVPESVRIAIMGHSSIAVTHGYEYADVSQARQALDRVAGRLQLG